MGWLHDLSIGWLALVVFAATYLVAAAIFVIVMALATGRRAEAFKAVSAGLLPPMGLLFGLLVAFLASQVWSDTDRAQLAVDREASSLRSVDLLMQAFPGDSEARMRVLLRRQIEESVSQEWPAMAQGNATLAVIPVALDSALGLALALVPRTEGQKTAQREMVASLQNALDARRQRIILSQSSVNWGKWAGVILVGALTLLAIAFVQSGNRLAAGIALGLFASAMACSVVLIASQDRPFSGHFRISPDLLQQVAPGNS
jgi:acyl-homoserine lactone acylase PvdQ